MTHNLKFIKLILKNIKSGLYDNICPDIYNVNQLFKYLERFDIIDDDLIYYRLIKNKCDDIPGIAEEDLGSYLHIPGNLYLEGTNITSLPDGLTVGGNLYLYGLKIKKIPDDAIIKGEIYK